MLRTVDEAAVIPAAAVYRPCELAQYPSLIPCCSAAGRTSRVSRNSFYLPPAFAPAVACSEAPNEARKARTRAVDGSMRSLAATRTHFWKEATGEYEGAPDTRPRALRERTVQQGKISPM